MPTQVSSSGIVQLVSRRPRAGERAESEFFTTWGTMEAGQWQSRSVNGLLQIRPSTYFGFRCMAHEFHVTRNIEVAHSLSLANPAYGPGGGDKLFIRAGDHATGLVPIGDLIYLGGMQRQSGPEPKGIMADIIELEISLANELILSDCSKIPHEIDRFWMQDTLHFSEIRSGTKLPSSFRLFEDPDVYGSETGSIDDDSRQILLSPMPRSRSSESWVAKLWRKVVGG